METSHFNIEIRLDTNGVMSVRVLGTNWSEGTEAHALLQELTPIIEKLDATSKHFGRARTNACPESVQ